MAGLAEQEVNFKNWKVPALKRNNCRLEEYLSPTKKEELVELTEKADELALELTDDSESISTSDVVNAEMVIRDGTILNPLNLHSDWRTDFSDAPNSAWEIY